MHVVLRRGPEHICELAPPKMQGGFVQWLLTAARGEVPGLGMPEAVPLLCRDPTKSSPETPAVPDQVARQL